MEKGPYDRCLLAYTSEKERAQDVPALAVRRGLEAEMNLGCDRHESCIRRSALLVGFVAGRQVCRCWSDIAKRKGKRAPAAATLVASIRI